MPKTYQTLTLAALMMIAAPVLAQEATSEEPAAQEQAADKDLSLGESVDQDGNKLGTTYDRETHGDWIVRCLRTEQEQDPCEINQMLDDGEGNTVAEVSLFKLPAGQTAVAGATIATPLETLLTEQLLIAVDGGPAKKYPYRFCNQMGCYAQIGFTAAEIDGFKKGNAATLSIVPRVAPDQRVNLTMSLSGFTDAFNAIPSR